MLDVDRVLAVVGDIGVAVGHGGGSEEGGSANDGGDLGEHVAGGLRLVVGKVDVIES